MALKGREFSIDIDRCRGRMAALNLKRNNFGQWNTVPGALEVVDELQSQTYRDGINPASVVVRKAGADKITVRKRFKQARFTIMETWTMNKEDAFWTVKIILDKGQKPRSIRIRQYIPWPSSEPFGWSLWTAQRHFPKSVCHVGQTTLAYGDVCFGTVIPILSIYKESSRVAGWPDVGLSFAKPFGLKIPRWIMIFDGYRGGGVTFESGYMKLADDHSAETALMLHPHAGCWRPGLGWLVKKYPSYFRPGHPRATELVEGGFMGGSPDSAEKEARIAKSYGAKIVEIHQHYLYYGHYFPTGGTWHTTESKAASKKERSVEKIRSVIRMFNQLRIAPCLYIQLGGDGYKPYVEKKFPESIALNRDGQRMGQSGYNVWMMNSDPSLPFGKFIDKEIDRFFSLYPKAGGLFWDQPCYDDIDSVHHDGLTMVNNKPMYRLVFCYAKHRDKMVRMAHERGMIVSANAPVYIELAEGLDQIMAEGTSWVAEICQYMCVARPMVFFHYFKNEDEVEEMFQKCLIAGGTCYTSPGNKFSPEVDRLFGLYKPLLSHLNGREWIFEPHPLEMPNGVAGNIFKGRDGNYYVVALSERIRLQDEGKITRKIIFNVSINKINSVRKVSYWGPGTGEQNAEFAVRNNKAKIILPAHRAISVVKLAIV